MAEVGTTGANEDDPIGCPHDDCERTFANHRQLRGHLGSSEHALDVPDGDFWCGYCGRGPFSWRGVNGHGGIHDGPVVRLDEEPDPADLIAPDDLPDHQDEALLRRLYAEHGGNISDVYRAHDFDVSPGRIRRFLIEFGIHEPTPWGTGTDAPDHRNPALLARLYEEHDGIISDVYRAHDFDVVYTQVVKRLKEFGIHDPESPPGRRHGRGGAKPAAERVDPVQPAGDVDAGAVGASATEQVEDDEADEDAPDETFWCGRCGYESASAVGVRRHNGIVHAGEPIVWDVEPAETDLVGDDPPDDQDAGGRDVQDHPPAEVDADVGGTDDLDDAEPEPKPIIEWDFEPGFSIVAKQEKSSSDRVIEGGHCVRCGEPIDGEGLCDYCADGVEADLVTDGGVDGVRDVVLELVDEHVDVDSPWIGRRALREEARKDRVPITVDEFDAAYHALRAAGEIVTWHGLTTSVDDEIVAAAIERESAAEFIRRPLIGRLNAARQEGWAPPAFGAAVGPGAADDLAEQEGADGG